MVDEKIMVGLEEEIIEDLRIELSDEPTFNENILRSKVKNALREVKAARKYPSYYTEKQIDNDMDNYFSNIRNIALYDYNQIGAEFQTSSSENNVSRSYTDRDKLFNGIIPLSKI